MKILLVLIVAQLPHIGEVQCSSTFIRACINALPPFATATDFLACVKKYMPDPCEKEDNAND